MIQRVLPTAAVTAATLGLPLASGCGSNAGARPVSTTTPRASSAAAPATPHAVPDPVLRTARKRYQEEAYGPATQKILTRLAHDAGLLRAVRSGSAAQVRSYVAGSYRPVWYHWHVSRMRITRGSTVLAEAGVPFVVRGPSKTLQAGGGPRTVLTISAQDTIGYIRFMRRNHGVQVVVRGQGARNVRTSLPAAARRPLPDSGSVTISGRRYRVVAFREAGWLGQPLKIWILS
jgi:hypothetical protein